MSVPRLLRQELSALRGFASPIVLPRDRAFHQLPCLRRHILRANTPILRAVSERLPRPAPPAYRLFHASSRRTYYDPNDPRLRSARPLITQQQIGRFFRSPSTYTVVLIAVIGAFAFYFSNLETVPVSGRTRFNCYSEESVRKTAEMQYKRILYEVENAGQRMLPDWDMRTIMVKRVMRKLIPFSGQPNEDWEVFVIEDPGTANAFVLPGGKVFVFSGILPLVRNDSALAAVLGHEIAHNVASHVAERMSSDIGVNILLYSLLLVGGVFGIGPLAAQIFGGTALDIVFARPQGRLQESEADYIGLMMMAEACYDPREAVEFWKRMDHAQNAQPPEWLSTHPSNQSRIEKIQSWLPKALEKREASDCQTTSAFADLFRKALDRGIILQEQV